MSEPKAIDPKLSTTDRVVKGKRRAAVARVHRVPQEPSRLASPPPASGSLLAPATDLLGYCATLEPPPLRALPPSLPPGPTWGIFIYGGVSWQMAEQRGGGGGGGGGGRGRPGGGCWQGVAAVTEIGSGWLLAGLHGIGFMIFFCRGRGDLWLLKN